MDNQEFQTPQVDYNKCSSYAEFCGFENCYDIEETFWGSQILVELEHC